MKVNLKCFASLVNLGTCDYKESAEFELDHGQTVEDLVQLVGISKKDVFVTFVNSKVVELDTVLSEGDQVGLAPAVFGM